MQAGNFSAEGLDGGSLLRVLGFEMVDVGGLRPELNAEGILGLAADLEKGGESGVQVSMVRPRGGCLVLDAGCGARSRSPVSPSTIPLSIGTASRAELL